MAGVTLYDYQLDAINRMKIGCILCGGVGSGKSRTSLAFYYKLYDGEVNTENYVRMTEPPDLYIITTARKRDTGEWDEELAHFYMSTDPEHDIYALIIVHLKNKHMRALEKSGALLFESLAWAVRWVRFPHDSQPGQRA